MRLPLAHVSRSKTRAFTLVEVLIGMTILLILMGVLFAILGSVARTWTQSTQRIDAFQSARVAFDRVTRMLSQATLNVYWDYDNPNNPKVYRRQSELAFAVVQSGTAGLAGDPSPGGGTGHGVFFQVPVGATAKTTPSDFRPLSQTLNSFGFSVKLVSDAAIRPPFITGPAKERLRLVQYRALSENLKVFKEQDIKPKFWIAGMEEVPLADNIIWMAIWPRLSRIQDPEGDDLTADYTYNSRMNADQIPQPVTAHQLPPTVQVTMIAIDEKTAARVTAGVLLETYAGTLADVTKYQEDVDKISQKLTDAKVNFRVFTTTVQLRESRWSP